MLANQQTRNFALYDRGAVPHFVDPRFIEGRAKRDIALLPNIAIQYQGAQACALMTDVGDL